MTEEATFPVKAGRIRITGDALLVERKNPDGTWVKAPGGQSLGQVAVTEVVFGAIFGYLGYTSYQGGNTLFAALCGLAVAWSAWNILSARDLSTTATIPRAAVKEILARKPGPPFRKGAFEVIYELDGRRRRRVVALPTAGDKARQAFTEGSQALKAAGLPLKQ